MRLAWSCESATKKMEKLTTKQVEYILEHVDGTGIKKKDIDAIGFKNQQTIRSVRGHLCNRYSGSAQKIKLGELTEMQQGLTTGYKARLLKLVCCMFGTEKHKAFRSDKSSSLATHMAKWQKSWDKRKKDSFFVCLPIALFVSDAFCS